ncbi:unnamed protein product [Boreogadus saida]
MAEIKEVGEKVDRDEEVRIRFLADEKKEMARDRERFPQSNRDRERFTQSDRQREPRPCHNCGQNGHWQREYRPVQRNRQTERRGRTMETQGSQTPPFRAPAHPTQTTVACRGPAPQTPREEWSRPAYTAAHPLPSWSDSNGDESPDRPTREAVRQLHAPSTDSLPPGTPDMMTASEQKPSRNERESPSLNEFSDFPLVVEGGADRGGRDIPALQRLL